MSRKFQGITVGQLVVVSQDPEATIFRVKEIKGFGVGVIDATVGIPNQAIQWQDRSIFRGLSTAQLARVAREVVS